MKIANFYTLETSAAVAKANRPESDAHWYRFTGEPCHELGLRDARKANKEGNPLFPSVTTIIGDTLAATGLNIWKQNQLLKAQHETPQEDAELLEDYFRRVIDLGKHEAKTAAAAGNAIHDDCETLLNGGTVEPTPRNQVISRWIDGNVESVKMTETVVVSAEVGIAGTLDALLILKGIEGQTVLDFKSRKFKEYKRPPLWRAGWYDKDLLQLSFYAHAVGPGTRIANLGINTRPDAPEDLAPELKLYTIEEQAAAFGIMEKLVAVWQWRHQYVPTISPEVFAEQWTDQK